MHLSRPPSIRSAADTTEKIDAALPACFCGSTPFRTLTSGSYDRLLLRGYEFQVVQCLNCTLARTLPIPDVEQYEKGYFVTTEQGRFVGSTEDQWSVPIIDFVGSCVEGRRLLDVGCHVGNLVAAAADRGYEAEGIDLDPVATAEGQRLGRTVRTGRLEEIETTFDIVVMNQLLENIIDLRTFIPDVARVLAPGGHAFVFVPFYRGLMPRLMGTHWMAWAPSRHVWHFTPESLIRVVHETSPLRLVRFTTNGVIEPPSSGMKGRMKAAVTAFSRATGRGDQIEAIFQKPEESANVC